MMPETTAANAAKVLQRWASLGAEWERVWANTKVQRVWGADPAKCDHGRGETIREIAWLSDGIAQVECKGFACSGCGGAWEARMTWLDLASRLNGPKVPAPPPPPGPKHYDIGMDIGLSSCPVVVVMKCTHPRDKVTYETVRLTGGRVIWDAGCAACDSVWEGEYPLQVDEERERAVWLKKNNMFPAPPTPRLTPPPKPVVMCKGCEQPLEDCTGSYRSCAVFASRRYEAGLGVPQTMLSHVAGFQLRAPPPRVVVLADDNSEPV